MNDNYYLCNLSDIQLDLLLSLRKTELEEFIDSLILRYHKNCTEESKEEIVNAYKSSFSLEKLLRENNKLLGEGNFVVKYTNNGFIEYIYNKQYYLDTLNTRH